MATYTYPSFADNRGPLYWAKPANIFASRTALRFDRTVRERDKYDTAAGNARSIELKNITGHDTTNGSRIIILGDTGEGDRSQYALLPLIRALKPNLLIINGDVAYPAGNPNDFIEGMFKPYSNLNVPIWGTPGNHEYYSENWARTFFQIFCTRHSWWSKYGLTQRVAQPGMYWEIRDSTSKTSVIGLDTGMCGNITGEGFFSWFASRDKKQLQWLLKTLTSAENDGYRVTILMHIPDLMNGASKKVNLDPIHVIASTYSCVSAVIAAHEHNYQHYPSQSFYTYLKNRYNVSPKRNDVEYFVSGCGGAALHRTDKFKADYACDTYPSANDWQQHVNGSRAFFTKTGAESLVPRGMHQLYTSAVGDDADFGKYLSLLLIEIPGSGTHGATITPYYLRDVDLLLNHLPPSTMVNILDQTVGVDPIELAACKQSSFNI